MDYKLVPKKAIKEVLDRNLDMYLHIGLSDISNIFSSSDFIENVVLPEGFYNTIFNTISPSDGMSVKTAIELGCQLFIAEDNFITFFDTPRAEAAGILGSLRLLAITGLLQQQ